MTGPSNCVHVLSAVLMLSNVSASAVSSRLGLSVLVGKLEAALHYVLFHSFHDFPFIYINLFN
jgi:hypothetical protein